MKLPSSGSRSRYDRFPPTAYIIGSARFLTRRRPRGQIPPDIKGRIRQRFQTHRGSGCAILPADDPDAQRRDIFMKHDRHRGRWAAAAAITGLALGAFFSGGFSRPAGRSLRAFPRRRRPGRAGQSPDAAHAGGWRNITDDAAIFEIQDGTLHIFGKSFYPLRYVAWETERLADFELHLEYRWPGAQAAGYFCARSPTIRCIAVLRSRCWMISVRAAQRGAGGIYDVVTPMFNLAPGGRMEQLRHPGGGPSCDGAAQRVACGAGRSLANDRAAGQIRDPVRGIAGRGPCCKPRRGRLYRNIFIRKLPGWRLAQFFLQQQIKLLLLNR